MANLTEISVGVRKIGKYAAIAIAGFLVLRFLIFIGVAYWNATHQVKEAPPNIAFGKLPKPKFPNNLSSSTGLTFTLQNIEGKPPETTASARIFSMPKKGYTFESGERARELARRLGFESEPQIDTVYYYFTKNKEPRLSLLVDSASLNFQYRYNFTENPTVFQSGQISSLEDVEKNSKEYLNFTNAWDKSILEGRIHTEILIFDDRIKKLVEATSLSTSQAVRVNFFRNDIDKLPLLPDEFNRSHNYVLYAPVRADLNNILEISYVFWPIDENTFGTYPLLTGGEAYQALVNGNATVIKKGDNGTQITIRKIYLAYSDSEIPQSYLQPIFVFEGDNNFVAYLSAVRPEYLE